MPSVEETTRYFDAHADRLRADRLVDKNEALRELLFEKLPPASRVIEVGAGTGLYTSRLLADGHRVVAVDLSQSCLDQIHAGVKGTEAADRLETWTGDFLAAASSFDAASFDAVTFIKVLHHFPDGQAIAAALVAAYDLLKPSGKLLIFEPNGSYPLWPPVLLARGYAHWLNERNVLLVRRRFLEGVLSSLPGARYSCRYRFVIPGGVIKRMPALAALDRRICNGDRPWLDRLAVNIAFEAIKPS